MDAERSTCLPDRQAKDLPTGQAGAVHITECRYANELLERYKNYKGRISTSCDACKDKSCIHNHAHLEDDGFEKEYAFNILKTGRFP